MNKIKVKVSERNKLAIQDLFDVKLEDEKNEIFVQVEIDGKEVLIGTDESEKVLKGNITVTDKPIIDPDTNEEFKFLRDVTYTVKVSDHKIVKKDVKVLSTSVLAGFVVRNLIASANKGYAEQIAKQREEAKQAQKEEKRAKIEEVRAKIEEERARLKELRAGKNAAGAKAGIKNTGKGKAAEETAF